MTIKELIIYFLKEIKGNEWVYGGTIEDYVRRILGNKASNVSRRCRELYHEGKLDRRLVKVNSVNVVQYRFRQKNPNDLI
jgi:hypothetical protein